jgi:hypothetical protein
MFEALITIMLVAITALTLIIGFSGEYLLYADRQLLERIAMEEILAPPPAARSCEKENDL